MRVVGRFKFWLILLILFIYILGIVILSAITLHNLKQTIPDENIKSVFPEEQHGDKEKSKLSLIVPRPRVPYRDNNNNNNNNLDISASGVFRSSSNRRNRIQWCSKLKFIPHDSNNENHLLAINSPVALVSFPGSGNTWLRYLLQQVTGLHTGSVYKDYGLLKNGFPAESITNSSVLVVKTHEWGPMARHMFSKAILLVRSPEKAIQAEFNRQSGGHIGFASSDRYKRTNGKYWRHFVYEKLHGWQQLNMDWLENFRGQIHVIMYEQLVDDIEHTLKSVVNFLGVYVPMKQFNCAIERKEGIYRRKRRVLSFDPFTNEMRAKIKEVQDKVYETIYKIKLGGQMTS